MHAVAHTAAVLVVLTEAVALLALLFLVVVATSLAISRASGGVLIAGSGPGSGVLAWRLSRLVDQLIVLASVPVGPVRSGPEAARPPDQVADLSAARAPSTSGHRIDARAPHA